ncbi:protein-glutamate O-methyltransferase [Hoeflea sp. TYP-13]|uniref:protein-glutamate O-methyltransferase n=1 Tax=Hoeflea sp. TYP-13 TaxID=3230023 RepID=UPI0034C6A966
MSASHALKGSLPPPAAAKRVAAAPSDQLLVDGEFRMTAKDLQDIASMIYDDAGIYLNESKASLVYSRLAKRIRRIGLDSFATYCKLVSSKEGADERRQMLSLLTTNFTRFFREEHHFDHLRDDVLPGLVAKAKAGGRVRIWSAGCSQGQEPYTIALTLLCAMPDAERYDVKILATDIDPMVVSHAREGVYDSAAIETVEPKLRSQWFKPEGSSGQWRVDPALKRLITFRELNLMRDWPFKGPFDVLFCRNVVIYFDEPTQARIWSRYSNMLAPGGWLYIGHSERLSGEAKGHFRNAGITTYEKFAGGA